MNQEQLILLGGIRHLLPVIDAVHKRGASVITADYLSDSYAHNHFDEWLIYLQDNGR